MLIEELKTYQKRLGGGLKILGERQGICGVPLFVAVSNDWYNAEIGGEHYVLVIAKNAGLSPQDIALQWKTISAVNEIPPVMILHAEESAFCIILNEASVDYIMPGSRLHVRNRMILVTRSAGRGGYTPLNHMSTAAQQVVLYYLNISERQSLLLSEIASRLGMTRAQVSTTAKELERLNLCAVDRIWRAHARVCSYGRR